MSSAMTGIVSPSGPSRVSGDEDSSRAMHARLAESAVRRRSSAGDDLEDDMSDSELFEELERELEEEEESRGIVGRIREDRMKELKRQIGEVQAQRNAPRGSGKVTEPSSEKELIQILGDRGGDLDGTKGGTPIVLHFMHKEFRRCEIMNTHLELLASQHPETLFLKISVLSSPFLVEKLGIKVLPCLVTFGAKANVKDQIVGFEDLGNSDGFTTKTLEWRLAQGGALKLDSANNGTRPILGFPALASTKPLEEDDDLDWD